MYESFFRFTARPFVAAPLVSNYFASESVESARQTLIRSIDRAEGPGLIIGPAGSGKTLLCRLLAARFQSTFQVAMLSSTRILTRKALLQNILFELKLPYRSMEEGELRLSLLDHLQPNEACPNGILLIVDEAHSLPIRLLEEIRMITNLVRDGEPRVRLVLAGAAKLEEKFASPKLESFNQRIAARCYLEPFGRDDTIDYVLSRITSAGGDADSLFDDGALNAVYQATNGIPRLINQVCDHVLVMAFAGGRQRIDAAGVEEAWADLQQLPGPWHDTPVTSQATIEFGELDAASVGSELTEIADSVLQVEVEPDVDLAIDPAADRASAGEPATDEAEPEPLPDVELSAVVADPFGDGFDEEEVVIDQAVIQSAEIFANRTRVVSEEGRDLVASMLPEAEHAPLEQPQEEPERSVEGSLPEEAADSGQQESKPAEQASDLAPDRNADTEVQAPPPVDWLSEAQFGSQMFEYTAFEPNAVAELALEALCDVNVAFGELEAEYDVSDEATVRMSDHSGAAGAGATPAARDDRGIIVVENDEPALPESPPDGAVHRIEYQALFSQLRHG